MDELRHLQSRIESLGELRNLVRTMRALAASRLQEAQGALDGIRNYAVVVDDAIEEAAALRRRRDGREPGRGPAGRGVLVVLCSEHGFAGGYSERLLDAAAARLEPGRDLAVVGTRGAALARERGLEPAWTAAMATHAAGVPACARQLAESLVEAGATDVLYSRFQTAGRVEQCFEQLLPLDPARFAGTSRPNPPVHHLAPEQLLQRLAQEYLFAELTRVAMETLASENAARLQAMHQADSRMTDRLDGLRRRERALRQESITNETLEVATGVQAVLEAEHWSG